MNKYTVHVSSHAGFGSDHPCNNLSDMYSIIGYVLSEKGAGQTVTFTITKHFDTRRK